eukprot:6194884-Pleurochrysis_carterae.AAC.4
MYALLALYAAVALRQGHRHEQSSLARRGRRQKLALFCLKRRVEMDCIDEAGRPADDDEPEGSFIMLILVIVLLVLGYL